MLARIFSTFVCAVAGFVILTGPASAQMLPIDCPTTNERTWTRILPNGDSSQVATFGVDNCWCSENDPSESFNNLTRRIMNADASRVRDTVALNAARAIWNDGGWSNRGRDLHPDVAPFFTSLQKGMRFTVNPADNSTKSETRYCISKGALAGYLSTLQPFAGNWRGDF